MSRDSPDGVADAPAVRGQHRARRVVRPGEHELEGDAGAPGQVDEPEKLPVLAPRVDLALPLDVLARLVPARHGREARRRRGGRGADRPPVAHDGLPRGPVREALDRDRAPRRAEVLAEGEVVRVGREEVDRELLALRDLDLGQHRIGLDVRPHGHLAVLLAQDGGRSDVEQRVGPCEELGERGGGQPEPGRPRRPRGTPSGPAARPRHEPRQVAGGVDGVVGQRLPLGIVRPRPRVLDVVDVAAEPAQRLDVVQRLPRHAGEGRLRDDAEDDDAGLHTAAGAEPPNWAR